MFCIPTETPSSRLLDFVSRLNLSAS